MAATKQTTSGKTVMDLRASQEMIGVELSPEAGALDSNASEAKIRPTKPPPVNLPSAGRKPLKLVRESGLPTPPPAAASPPAPAPPAQPRSASPLASAPPAERNRPQRNEPASPFSTPESRVRSSAPPRPAPEPGLRHVPPPDAVPEAVSPSPEAPAAAPDPGVRAAARSPIAPRTPSGALSNPNAAPPADADNDDAISNHDPMWFSMFTPGEQPQNDAIGADAEFDIREKLELPETPLARRDDAEESEETDASRAEFWKALQGLMLNSRVAMGALCGLVLIAVITSLDTIDTAAASETEESVSAMNAAGVGAGSPLERRAALFIVDEFRDGVDGWTGSESLEVTEAGSLRVSRGISLRRSTLGLRDSRFEFEARAERGGIGWLVRASENGDHYAYKLEPSNSRLARRAMVEAVADEPTYVQVPPGVLKSDDFNRISVHIEGDRISTVINGRGVDVMKDPRLATGGIGFFAAAGESALVRKLTVVANDDFLGMVLFGTLDSLGEIKR